MESKITYRDAPPGNIRLPKEVYHRCQWLVRDSARLRKLAEASLEGSENTCEEGMTKEIASAEEIYGPVTVADEAAIRRAVHETDCIQKASEKIPEVYREGLLDNIINRTPFADFAHPNTWKRWKLVFMYELAKEIHLI